jgi:uncharacterized protein (DUF1499 family)
VKQILILAVIVAAVLLLTTWPRINDVETSQTPEYPDLKDQSYVAREDRVAEAAKEAIASLSRWTFVGAGKGPGGSEIKAVATTKFLGFKDDVTIRIRWTDGRTVVSVHSKSRTGKLDFGQNARNIREFFEALNKRVV